jgi:hypothetical protein
MLHFAQCPCKPVVVLQAVQTKWTMFLQALRCTASIIIHPPETMSCKHLPNTLSLVVLFAAVEDETTRLAGIVNNQGRIMIVSLHNGSCSKHHSAICCHAPSKHSARSKMSLDSCPP